MVAWTVRLHRALISISAIGAPASNRTLSVALTSPWSSVTIRSKLRLPGRGTGLGSILAMLHDVPRENTRSLLMICVGSSAFPTVTATPSVRVARTASFPPSASHRADVIWQREPIIRCAFVPILSSPRFSVPACAQQCRLDGRACRPRCPLGNGPLFRSNVASRSSPCYHCAGWIRRSCGHCLPALALRPNVPSGAHLSTP